MKRIPSFALSDEAHAILKRLRQEMADRGVKKLSTGKVIGALLLRYDQLLAEVEDTKPP